MTQVRALFMIEQRGYNHQQLMRGREEARQEAVLWWEAKYHNSVGENELLLLEDLIHGGYYCKRPRILAGEVARI